MRRRFRQISDHLPKILENFPKLFRRRQDERYRTFGKNFRRLPYTLKKDLNLSRSYTNEFKYNLRNKLDISEIIDIFTGEDMENTPLESRPKQNF